MVEEKQEGGVFCPHPPGKIGLKVFLESYLKFTTALKKPECKKNMWATKQDH